VTNNNIFDDHPPLCPHCDTAVVVPVLYQEPSDEMVIAAKLGQIALGTTPESPGAPQWKCQSGACGLWF